MDKLEQNPSFLYKYYILQNGKNNLIQWNMLSCYF